MNQKKIGKTFFGLISEIIDNDKNTKMYIITDDNGYAFIVYDRNRFLNDYKDTFLIDKVSVIQEPTDVFDFYSEFKKASQEDIDNTISAYVDKYCIPSSVCKHKIVIKIKEDGDFTDMYRSLIDSCFFVYSTFQLNGKLNLSDSAKELFSRHVFSNNKNIFNEMKYKCDMRNRLVLTH